ncbi:carbohydrate-binding protein [Streptomyces sp. UG1]|uniref:carbohydrate-binding protein n=1 Tax=Streptomyces sp. UG1 TaxID=3417652 RepID=UPI003CF79AD5
MFRLEPTGAWNNWATATVTVPVMAGSNAIRLVATTDGGLANIDYIGVSMDGTTPPTMPDVLYAATNGNDSGPGTLARPLRAVDLAEPGDTIEIRGGTYAPSTNIRILKNGARPNPSPSAATETSGWSSTARTCRTRRARSAPPSPVAARRDPHRG